MPQQAQQRVGYTATLAGRLLAPGTLLLIVLIPPISKAMNVVPVKYVIAFGGLALGSALFFFMNLVPGLDFFRLALHRAGQSGALAFPFVPTSTIACAKLPGVLNDAAALFSMVRSVVGGLGIPVATSRATDHLFPGSQPYDVLSRQVQQPMRAAPGSVFQMLRNQSAVLPYTEVFLLAGCAALLFIPTALMLPHARPRPGGGGH